MTRGILSDERTGLALALNESSSLFMFLFRFPNVVWGSKLHEEKIRSVTSRIPLFW